MGETMRDWWPGKEKYTPGLTVDDWRKLLGDRQVFTRNALTIMKRMLDIGGAATCKQLSETYGESANFYNGGSSYLAKRVQKATGCPVMIRDNENARWWPILFVGRHTDSATSGVYMWKLRDELKQALQETDICSPTPMKHSTNRPRGGSRPNPLSISTICLPRSWHAA